MKLKYISHACVILSLSTNVFGSEIENITEEEGCFNQDYRTGNVFTGRTIQVLNHYVKTFENLEECGNDRSIQRKIDRLYREVGKNEGLFLAVVQNDLVSDKLLEYCERYPRKKDFHLNQENDYDLGEKGPTLKFSGLVTLPDASQMVIKYDFKFSRTSCTGEELMEKILIQRNGDAQLPAQESGKERKFTYTRRVMEMGFLNKPTREKIWVQVEDNEDNLKNDIRLEKRWIDTSHRVEDQEIEGQWVQKRNRKQVWKKRHTIKAHWQKEGHYEKGYYAERMKAVEEEVETFIPAEGFRPEQYGITILQEGVGETYFFNELIDLKKLAETFGDKAISFDMRYS